MKSFGFYIIILLIISCNKKTDKILPLERHLTESVYSSVTIQPDSLYHVHAIVSGIIEKNFVEVGDIILKDKALVQINNISPKLNTQNAKFALELAKENYYGGAAILNSIENEISAAGLSYKNDSINYFRQKNLWEKQIGSKAQFDNMGLKYQLSSNNLELLQNKYDRTKNELLTTLKQAENNYKNSLITTKDFTIKSNMNGTVYAFYKEPGEIVTIMEPIASIGSSSNFIIEMLVDEVDIVSIKINQEVIINLDAYQETVFKGKVFKIHPKKDERNQTFLVEAIFDVPPKILYPGLSGEANIIIREKENALTIPKAYVFDNDKVKTDEGLITITTGLENLEFIEVLSGISKETYIYLPEND